MYTQEELWQSNKGWENCRIASEKRARHASVFRSNDSGSRRRIRSLVSRVRARFGAVHEAKGFSGRIEGLDSVGRLDHGTEKTEKHQA